MPDLLHQDEDDWTVEGISSLEGSEGFLDDPNNWGDVPCLDDVYERDDFHDFVHCLSLRHKEHKRREREWDDRGGLQNPTRKRWCACVGGAHDCVLLDLEGTYRMRHRNSSQPTITWETQGVPNIITAPTPQHSTQRRSSPRLSQQLSTDVESSPPRSIRASARVRSISSGRQSADSSSYNIHYRSQSTINGDDSDSSPRSVHDPLSQLNYLALEPHQGPFSPQAGLNESQPDANTGEKFPDNERVCFCDNSPMPFECRQCSQSYYKNPCNSHALVFCKNAACAKGFHQICVSNQLDHAGEYTCMECRASTVIGMDTPYNELPQGTNGNRIKNARLGFPYLASDMERAWIVRHRDKLLKIIRLHTVTSVANAITNNDPREFPSTTPLTPHSALTHVIQGRRFEIAMQLFAVDQCTCCGRVHPGNVDPMEKKYYPMERKLLTNTYEPGWHCTCNGFCAGSQFYAHSKLAQIKQFKEVHGGQSPWEYLGRDKSNYNALLCTKCHRFPDTNSSQKTSDLKFHRKFSLINGFGPVHVPPVFTPLESPEVTRSRELHQLLTSFTSAEEAAIRQIAPLIQITKLRRGTLGCGATHPVFMSSQF